MWLCGLRRPKRPLSTEAYCNGGVIDHGQQATRHAAELIAVNEDSKNFTSFCGTVICGPTSPPTFTKSKHEGDTGRIEVCIQEELNGKSRENGDPILEEVLSQLWYPVTLIDADSVVLLQNDASRRLWGDLVSNPSSKHNVAGSIATEQASHATPMYPSLLQVIFSSDKDALLEALTELEEGRVWRGLLRMPQFSDVQAPPAIAALGIIQPGSGSLTTGVTSPASIAYIPATEIITPQVHGSLLATTSPAPAVGQVGQSVIDHKTVGGGGGNSGDAETRLQATPSGTFHTFTLDPDQQPHNSGLHAEEGEDVEACLDTSQSNARSRRHLIPAQPGIALASAYLSQSKSRVPSVTNVTVEPTTKGTPYVLQNVLRDTPVLVPGDDPAPPVSSSCGDSKVTDGISSTTAAEAFGAPGIAILESRLSQIVSASQTIVSSTTQMDGATFPTGHSRSQSRFRKEFSPAYAAMLRGDVSSSTVGLLPQLTQSSCQSWGSLGGLSTEPVARSEGTQLLQATTGNNSAAGLAAMVNSVPGAASGNEAVVESSRVAKLEAQVNRRDVTTDAVSSCSHAGLASWFSRSRNHGPSQDSVAPKSVDATVGSFESSWLAPRTSSRRSAASYAPVPVVRMNSATSGSMGRGPSAAGGSFTGQVNSATGRVNSATLGNTGRVKSATDGSMGTTAGADVGPTTQTQQHQQLLAEGLTTSALGTLVRGGSPRLPRRNMSATVLMSSSNNATHSSMLRTSAEDRCIGTFLSGYKGDGRNGRRQLVSTPENSFGMTTDGIASNAYICTLGSVDAKGTPDANVNNSYVSCFSFLLGTEKNLPPVGDGGGLQGKPLDMLSTSKSRSDGPAAGSDEALRNIAMQLDSNGLMSGVWAQNTEPYSVAQSGDLPQAGTSMVPSGPGGLLSTNRTLNSGQLNILSTDASSSSRRESAIPSRTSTSRPTSAMHRLLNMALHVAGGAPTSASSSRAMEFENMTRVLSQTHGSAPKPPSLHGLFPREECEPSVPSLPSPQQPPVAVQHLVLPVLSAATSRQNTAVLFRGIHGTPSAPKSGGSSRANSYGPFSSGGAPVTDADVEVERTSIRTSSSITATGVALVSSSVLTFTRGLMSGTSVGMAADDSVEVSGKQRFSSGIQAGKLALGPIRAEVPLGPLRVAKFGQHQAGSGSHGGPELTFGNAAPRMSTATLEGLFDMRESILGSGSKGGTDSNNAGRGRPPVNICSSAASAAASASGNAVSTMASVPEAAATESKNLVEVEEQPPAMPLSQWHEVTLTRFMHPTLHRPVIMMVQNDVSARVWAERQIARVMEAEHSLLENIFPIHVIQHIAATAAQEAESEEGPAQPSVVAPAAATPKTRCSGPGQLHSANGSNRGGVGGGGSVQPAAAYIPAVPLITGGTFLHLATSHSALTVLFCDIQGFTSMCNVVKPATVMAFLNDLYTRLDAMLDVYGVYKVETIGDCYVVAGGLMKVDEDTGAVTVRSDEVDPQHAHRIVQFAKALLAAAAAVHLPTTGQPVRMRVGIHSGPAMSGVVGTRMPRFCLFGDTVNTASRMESTGLPGAIHVSQATRDLVPGEDWTPTGGVEAKGKGVLQTYILKP